jgi:hypothetical protein
VATVAADNLVVVEEIGEEVVVDAVLMGNWE